MLWDIKEIDKEKSTHLFILQTMVLKVRGVEILTQS